VVPIEVTDDKPLIDHLLDAHSCPLAGVLKFGKAEAGLAFTFAGEKLLHQPFFMGLERVDFPRLRGHQLVYRTQALGDSSLFRD